MLSLRLLSKWHPTIRRQNFASSTKRPGALANVLLSAKKSVHGAEVGPERNSIGVAALVDTNVLVYWFDSRFPEK